MTHTSTSFNRLPSDIQEHVGPRAEDPGSAAFIDYLAAMFDTTTARIDTYSAVMLDAIIQTEAASRTMKSGIPRAKDDESAYAIQQRIATKGLQESAGLHVVTRQLAHALDPEVRRSTNQQPGQLVHLASLALSGRVRFMTAHTPPQFANANVTLFTDDDGGRAAFVERYKYTTDPETSLMVPQPETVESTFSPLGSGQADLLHMVFWRNVVPNTVYGGGAAEQIKAL